MRIAKIDFNSKLITIYPSKHDLLCSTYGVEAVAHNKSDCSRRLAKEYQTMKLARPEDYQELIKEVIIHRGRYAIIAECFCLNCDLPLTGGRRWCSSDCRDEWQDEQNKKQRR